jgi:hypothetical protein
MQYHQCITPYHAIPAPYHVPKQTVRPDLRSPTYSHFAISRSPAFVPFATVVSMSGRVGAFPPSRTHAVFRRTGTLAQSPTGLDTNAAAAAAAVGGGAATATPYRRVQYGSNLCHAIQDCTKTKATQKYGIRQGRSLRTTHTTTGTHATTKKGEDNAQISQIPELCGFKWANNHNKCVHDSM